MKACGFGSGERLYQGVISEMFEAPFDVVDKQRPDDFWRELPSAPKDAKV